MKKLVTLFLLTLLLHTQSFSQVKIKDVDVPTEFKVETSTLVLNGAGLRNKFFIDVYVGALYLPKKSTNAQAIIAADQPFSVRLQIISTAVTMERMAEAIREGFDRSLLGNTTKLRDQIDEIVAIFLYEPVKVGDYFDIWYVPGKGVMASKNKKKYAILIPGLAFKKALLGIWLCPIPVDNNLKNKMLGL
jgi:Chalcone isomerase-like